MPFSYIDYGTTGDLAGDQLSLQKFTPTTLQFVSSADIYVTRTTSLGEVTTLTSSQFTVETSPSLSVTIKTAASGGIDLNASDIVRIGRTTDITALSRTFTDGSVLKASDLNTQNTQLLYVVQENKDDVGGTLPIATDGKYDAGGRVIKNLGLGVNDGDSVTLGYVNQLSLYGSASGGVTPQFWTFTTAAGDIVGNDRVFTLTTPVPSTAVNNMFIVEVDGVMQRPSATGTDGDYDVNEVGESYTIKFMNAATGQSQEIANGKDIVCRNFGTTRNTLVAPFKSATTAGVSLAIEKIAGQTGDLIKADDSSGTDFFRVEADGSVLLGDGAAGSTATTKLSTNSLEIANQDLTSGDKHNQYGAVMQVLDSNRGHLSIQGNQTAADGNYALRVDKGQSDGSLVNSFYVTYGGAIVTTGAITATGTVTSGGFSTTAASSLGNVTLVDGSTFAIGSGKIEITNDAIDQVHNIGMEHWGTDNSGSIRSVTTTVPGGFGVQSSGPKMALGGNGSGVTYGGHGSRVFTQGGAATEGPYFQVTNYGLTCGGFMVPETQGGLSGETGTSPAYFRYASGSGDFASTVTYADMQNTAIPAKKQIDQAISSSADAVTASNKYELIASHTFSSDKAALTRASGVDWAARYSMLKLVLEDVVFPSSNYYGLAIGIHETPDGFTGDARALTNSGGSTQNWTTGGVNKGGQTASGSITSGPGFIWNNSNGSIRSSYGSTVVDKIGNQNTPTYRGCIDFILRTNEVLTMWDVWRYQSGGEAFLTWPAVCACNTSVSKLYRIWVFANYSATQNSSSVTNITSGRVHLYGIKR